VDVLWLSARALAVDGCGLQGSLPDVGHDAVVPILAFNASHNLLFLPLPSNALLAMFAAVGTARRAGDANATVVIDVSHNCLNASVDPFYPTLLVLCASEPLATCVLQPTLPSATCAGLLGTPSTPALTSLTAGMFGTKLPVDLFTP
jgi:hypothetical protein